MRWFHSVKTFIEPFRANIARPSAFSAVYSFAKQGSSLLALVFLASCGGATPADVAALLGNPTLPTATPDTGGGGGGGGTPTPTATPSGDTKQFRIVASPTGTTTFPATTLTTGQSVSLRAILFNVTTNSVIREVAAAWIPIGTLSSSNGITTNSGMRYQYTANTAGVGYIQAFLADAEKEAGVNETTISEFITANVPDVPASISILSGNNQSGVVSTNLANPFSVFVATASGMPITGATVTFAPLAGGGSITCGTAGAVTTNFGVANCFGSGITMGPATGSAHTFTATVTGVAPVTFSATPIATTAGDTKQFRIVAAPAGTTTFPATTLSTGQSANLRAILFNVTTNSFIREVAASWVALGSLSPADTATSGGGKYFQFTANNPGSGYIQAFLDPSEMEAGVNSTAISDLITSNVPAIPAAITILGGNNQTGTVNSNLGTAYSVFVTTSTGAPVTGATVTFAVNTGSGSSVTCGNSGAVSTNSGIATCNVVTLGPTTGTYTFTATVASVGAVTFTATANAVTATSPTLVKIYGSPAGTTEIGATSLTNGQTLPLRAVLYRPGDNTIVKEIIVSWTTTGTLNPANITTSAAGARATYAPTATASGTIQATLTDSAEIAAYNVQPPYTQLTGTITASITQTPTQIQANGGGGQIAPKSTMLPNPLVAIVRDASNNPVPGITVNFASGSGGSVSCLGGGASAVTGNDGNASCSGVLGSSVGNQTFSATVAGVAGSADFTANATNVSVNPAAAIAVDPGSITSGTAGSALSGLGLLAEVTDSVGDPVQGTSVTFSVVSGGGSINCTNPKATSSDGLVSCSVTLGSTVGNQVFRATVTGSSPTISTDFTVAASHPPTRLRIYPLAGVTAVGDLNLTIGDPAYDFVAVLEDAGGNVVDDSASPVTATWIVSGLSAARLSTSGSGKYAAYNPSGPDEVGVITAIASAGSISAYNITQSTTATGTITVAYALLPDRVSIVSATNNQSATVQSDITLTANVKNTGNVNVPGASVRFQPSTGGGSVACISFATCSCVSNQDCTATTDSSGNASIRATLGCQTGTNNQTFNATISGAGVTVPQVTFNATATPGTATQLAFTTSPGSANIGSQFGIQPRVEIRDACNNTITSDNATVVTIPTAPNTGTGVVSGTRTATAVAGVATFLSLQYSVSENNVRLTATATGLTNGVSGAFDVGSIIAAGQCAGGAPSNWVTSEGGCRDISTGLVWSSRRSTGMTWGNAVWDSTSNGSAPEALEASRGIVRDMTVSSPLVADPGFAGECHDMTESGFSDWRLPSYWDILAMNSPTSGLQNWTGTYWSSTVGSATTAFRFQIGTGFVNDGNSGFGFGYSVRCVRQTTADRLAFSTDPYNAMAALTGGTALTNIGFGRNVPFAVQPVVALRDSSNYPAYPDTKSVTISASVTGGSGSLVGTTTVNTVNGVATFTDLAWDGTGTVTLTATASGLNSAAATPITVNSSYAFAQCKATSANWINSNGGCKHVPTGIIYSQRIGTPTNQLGGTWTWHDAVWGGPTIPGSASPVDSYDNGRTDDYDPATTLTGNTDTSSVHVCKSLNQQGYQDWRMPTSAEVVTGSGSSANLKIMDQTPGSTTWSSSTSASANSANHNFCTFGGACNNNAGKTTAYTVSCVRRDPPASLLFTTQPAANGNGFGAGIYFVTAPVISARDADNSPALGSGTITISLIDNSTNVAPVNGAQVCTLDANYVYTCANSIDFAMTNGTATLSFLSISMPGTYRLRAVGSGFTWNGASVSVTSAESSAIVIPTLYVPSTCATVGFTSTNGGCQDGNGKVWSHIIETRGSPTVAVGMAWDGAFAAADNDAANGAGTFADTNTASNTCQDLVLNGYSDWRLPTITEYVSAGSTSWSAWRWGGITVSNGCNNTFWTSSTVSSTNANMRNFAFSGSSASSSNTVSGNKTTGAGANCGNNFVRCVRP